MHQSRFLIQTKVDLHHRYLSFQNRKQITLHDQVVNMGSMFIAQCDCGFESNMMHVGGGMRNFNEVLNAPALCEKCQILLVKNYLKQDPRCSRCGVKIKFYNDPSLFKGLLPKNISDCLFYWRLPDDFNSSSTENNDFFCLPKADYLCPRCGKMNIRFIECGCWD